MKLDVSKASETFRLSAVNVIDPKRDHSFVTSQFVVDILPGLARSLYSESPKEYQGILCDLATLLHLRGRELSVKRKIFAAKKGFITHKGFTRTALSHNRIYYCLTSAADVFICRRGSKDLDAIIFIDGAKGGKDIYSQLDVLPGRMNAYTQDLADAKGLSAVSAAFGDMNTYITRITQVQQLLHDHLDMHLTTNDHLTITLCGWSIGGVVASLAAAEIVPKWGSNVNVVTFGTQRFARPDLLRFLMIPEIRPKQYIRIFNPKDSILKYPPKSFGFLHVDEFITNEDTVTAASCSPPTTIVKLVSRFPLPLRVYLWHTMYFLANSIVLSSA